MKNEDLTYSKVGLLLCDVEEWRIPNTTLLHRDDCPAQIYTFKDGAKWEVHWNNGKRHRVSGPAVLYYNEKHHLYNTLFYFNGIELTEDQHKIAVFCGGVDEN